MTVYSLDVLLSNFEPVQCSMSGSKFCFLVSLLLWVSQEAGQVVWYSHLLRNFPHFAVIHTVKGFGIVNKVEVDVFLEFFCFFCNPADVGNLISGSSAFSEFSLYFWKYSVRLKDIGNYFASMWNECSCVVVWAFFGVALLWDWNESWPFPVLWPLLTFTNLLAYWVQHFKSIIF